MKIGNTNITNLKLGIVQIKKVFIGLDLVWTSFLSIINDFKTRVLGNQGQFEGETCLNDGLEEIGVDLFDDASIVVTPNGTKVSKLYSIKPSNGTGDLTVTRATTATRVNSAGLIESVGANIARLDYTNGSCPSILVEPQRTNLLLQSETFTNGWTSEGATISANTITSPDGNLTADVLSELATNDVHRTYRNTIATIANAKYTTSFFVKKNNVRYVRLIITQNASSTIWAGAQFDLDTQTFTSQVGTGGGTFVSATIKAFSDGWYRVSVTGSITGTSMIPMLVLSNGSAMLNTDTRGCPIYLGNTSNSLFIWGAQLEAGSNATSYIPTTTGAVTRNADVISKTGISSLIGQTEGSVLLNFFYPNNITNTIELFNIWNSSTSYLIRSRINDAGSNIVSSNYATGGSSFSFHPIFTLIPNSINKICIVYSYATNTTKLFVNGVLIGSTIGTNLYPTSTQDKIGIGNWFGVSNTSIWNNISFWKTQLSDAQALQLTTL